MAKKKTEKKTEKKMKGKVFNFISKGELLDLADEFYARHLTKRQACEALVEYFKKQYKVILTIQQIYDKVAILRKRRQAQLDKIEAAFIKSEEGPAEEAIKDYAMEDCASTKSAIEAIEEVRDQYYSMADYTLTRSELLLDRTNKKLDYIKTAYSMITGQTLVATVNKIAAIQNRRRNKVSIRQITTDLANFFNVKPQTLYTRYMSNVKRKDAEKEYRKSLEDLVKTLQSQIALYQTTEKELKANITEHNRAITKSRTITEQYRSMSIREFIFRKLTNKLL